MNIAVTGGAGFLGSHLCDRLRKRGHEPFVVRKAEYDLRTEMDTERLFVEHRDIDLLYHLAATVGGIGLNKQHPGSLFYENMKMGLNVIEYARLYEVKKVVVTGSVCGYPSSTYTLREEALWDGYPSLTNAPYGVAKKALLVMLQAYRQEYGLNGVYVLPTNLYGPRDNFDLETSHVIPALIKKCVEAKRAGADHVVAWGTGSPTRDFLYVEDAAEALVLVGEKYNRPEPLNLGSGCEVRIDTLLHYIQQAVGYEGRIVWDTSRPDGQARRVLDSQRAKQAIGWEATTPLLEGLKKTVEWYEQQR